MSDQIKNQIKENNTMAPRENKSNTNKDAPSNSFENEIIEDLDGRHKKKLLKK